MRKIFLICLSSIFLFLVGCHAPMTGIFSSNEQSPPHHREGMQDHGNRPMHGGKRPMHGEMEEEVQTNHRQMMGRNGQASQIQSSKGVNELEIPPLLQPVKEKGKDIYYEVEAQEGITEIFPNIKTNTLGYNGNFLGPAIRIKEDQKVHMALKNSMQEETTVHWHGLLVGGQADGGPHDIIAPGEEKNISFQVQQGAGTLWFHPHPLGKTAKQVYEGLAGLLLIDGKYDKHFSYGENDFPLIIQDKMFTDDGQLDYASAYHPNGTIGDRILINGTIDPRLTVQKEKVRLRLLNGSNTRSYTFSFDNKLAFQQIASDGGLLNAPLEMNAITLAPSERAEIIVDFSEENGEVGLLADENILILPIHVKDMDGDDTGKDLQPMERVKVTDEEKNLPVTKHIEMFGMGPHVTINGKKFDPDRIDFTQEKGITEIWEIYNKPDMMGSLHPFHIHGTQFKVISINGQEPPAHLQGYKDTISLQAGDKAKIAVKFEEAGIYMYHCHILEHEDNGMMGQVEVKE